MSIKNSILLLFIVSLLFVSCTSDEQFKSKLEKTLNDNPDLITEVIKKNPEKFFQAFQQMAYEARKKAQEDREVNESQEIDRYFKEPMKYLVREDELIRGVKNAPITIVEYSDFECPFCAKGELIVKELLRKYEGKVSFIYKHLPIDSIHPNARLAAQYYEAIRITAGEKAIAFHDKILNNQQKIRLGEKYFDSVVKEIGLDVSKIKLLASSEKVNTRIKQDEEEARVLGFSGTPGFLVNGIPVRGAYPVEHFEKLFAKFNIR